MAFRILEALLWSVFVLFVIFQVVVPLWKNRPPFPIFRRGAKLERELGGVLEEVDNKTILTQIKKVKKQLKS